MTTEVSANTHEYVKQLLDQVCMHLNMPTPKLEMTNKSAGSAVVIRMEDDQLEKTISIPVFALKHSVAFVQYYVVHECMHLHLNTKKHDAPFKLAESKTCEEMFRIGIKYSRAYPKYLFDIDNPNKVLWGQSVQRVGNGFCLKGGEKCL